MRRRTVLAGVLAGCSALLPSRQASSQQAVRAAETRVVAIGVTPGPHAEIIEVVRRVAAGRGIDLRPALREAGRGVNADVAAGRLDAACFQNAVAFAAEMQRRRDTLVNVAATITRPMAIYSRRLAALKDLGEGASIGIPDSPAVAARALLLLHNHGLLLLREGAGFDATPKDVVGNRLRLRLRPLPAQRLAGALDHLDGAAIDAPHAEAAGLLPARDSIGMEDARTPYTDILAVRSADRAQQWVAELIDAYRSEAVKRFILERFQDSVRRPW